VFSILVQDVTIKPLLRILRLANGAYSTEAERRSRSLITSERWAILRSAKIVCPFLHASLGHMPRFSTTPTASESRSHCSFLDSF